MSDPWTAVSCPSVTVLSLLCHCSVTALSLLGHCSVTARSLLCHVCLGFLSPAASFNTAENCSMSFEKCVVQNILSPLFMFTVNSTAFSVKLWSPNTILDWDRLTPFSHLTTRFFVIFYPRNLVFFTTMPFCLTVHMDRPGRTHSQHLNKVLILTRMF